ncbi:SOUL heme-binding family protein [Striga hermonthica]|uniref:SOUL heme-binding family protein n=1 Tax=Striga hermonthica TaxID=68872 RepID=A0A9N7NGU3_STRHE|nr:SOUL heme-binding family protein [Striga hermonthica]
MGMILGKIGVETPKHEIIAAAAGYEIRKYPPAVVAEVTYDPAQFTSEKDGAFKILADYIGAFGEPRNARPERIAMTAPVLTAAAPAPERIAMTAPVVTAAGSGGMVTMGFILPAKYARAADAPLPVDGRVALRDEGERKYGVVRFGGSAREEVVEEKASGLRECLERDGYRAAGDFVLARYNPPWITLPPFRTNEVMIPVE